jgi:hypothetical protein
VKSWADFLFFVWIADLYYIVWRYCPAIATIAPRRQGATIRLDF